ncbi:hypothetical protein MA16_Dca009076 [Dendrobium catenatum]|uniref:Uncharacterized protein n=1 Tax=Dendrobium catenatum TaxID=906689 RepID=A0A2I0VRH0_9ASPA|nr:hypothetical protein MA16_Dca009076 [Dendrobium catenatum]
MLVSESSSFGKHRTSSELNFIDNTIRQKSGAVSSAYFSLAYIFDIVKMTRHVSVGRDSFSVSSSFSSILSSFMKSPSLIGLLAVWNWGCKTTLQEGLLELTRRVVSLYQLQVREPILSGNIDLWFLCWQVGWMDWYWQLLSAQLCISLPPLPSVEPSSR